ncbi:MAG: succinyl-diaminopimelate desuccinylase [bacterium]|nr:succinyl-diaminopimelate desuccinylase [bacterium]
MIETDSVRHAVKLIQCKSVTPIEGGALDYLEQALSKIGFACTRLPFREEGTPDVDNLYARIGTNAPNICFAGHTDVVPVGDETDWEFTPFEARIDNQILHGRGSADMKGSIACFLAAVEAFLSGLSGDLPGSISFLITGDEEGPAINGTVKMLDWLDEHGEKLDHCIVGEPSNPDKIGEMIKIGRRGSMNGDIIIIGKQGHVAYQHMANNPIEGLAMLISKLLGEPLDIGTSTFMPSNLEITNLKVNNEAVNVIPARASARFNIRFNDAHSPSSLEQLMRDRIKTALAGSPYGVELAFRVSGDSFVTKSGDFTDKLSEAIKRVTGLTPELSTTGGTSDARFIKKFCPVIEFGLVNATIHQVDEQVPLAHMQTLTAIYTAFLKTYFPKD